MRTLQIFLGLKYQELIDLTPSKESWEFIGFFGMLLSGMVLGCIIIGSIIFGIAHLINPEYFYLIALLSINYPTTTPIPGNFFALSFILGAQIIVVCALSWSMGIIFIEVKNFFSGNWKKAQLIAIKEREDGR